MPVIVVVLIAALMGWLVLAHHRPNDRLARSRAEHPSSAESSSVHIVHLGRDDY
jgi:hypothetical protein